MRLRRLDISQLLTAQRGPRLISIKALGSYACSARMTFPPSPCGMENSSESFQEQTRRYVGYGCSPDGSLRLRELSDRRSPESREGIITRDDVIRALARYTWRAPTPLPLLAIPLRRLAGYSPAASAIRINSETLRTPVLAMRLARYTSTVRGLMLSS